MKIFILFTLFFEILTINHAISSGSYVGNGGDTIYCAPSIENKFSGHYTLDYLLEYKTTNFEISNITKFEETVARLSNFFLNNYPEIYPLFREFTSSIEQDSNQHKRRWIIKNSAELIDIHDENIIHNYSEVLNLC